MPGAAGTGVVGTAVGGPQGLLAGVAATGFAGQVGVAPSSAPSIAAGIGTAGQISITVSGGGTSRRTGLEAPKRAAPKVQPFKAPTAKPLALTSSPTLAPLPLPDSTADVSWISATKARIEQAAEDSAIDALLARHVASEAQARQTIKNMISEIMGSIAAEASKEGDDEDAIEALLKHHLDHENTAKSIIGDLLRDIASSLTPA